MGKILGILGGMGPLATADLFKKIVLLTKASSDSEHIRVIMDNHAAIPDRTAAILSGGENPVPYMLESLQNLEKCGAECVIMPCNTAHYFLPQLQQKSRIPFLSILDAAAEACRREYPGKTAAILGTKGTLATKLYDDALSARGINFITPDKDAQDTLMRVIYDGVKSNANPDTYRADFEFVLESLRKRGAEYFITGCTELPLAVDNLGLNLCTVDPTTELAKVAIQFCGYQVKNDLQE